MPATVATALTEGGPGHLSLTPPRRYEPPPVDPMIRPSGHPERYCAYHSVIGSTATHFHAVAELTLVLHGAGEARIGGRSYPVQRGSFSLALPNVPHNQTCDEPIGKLVCMFDMGLVEPLLARDPILGHLRAVGGRYPAALQLAGAAAGSVAELFRQLLGEYGNPVRPGSGAAVGAVATQLLIAFVRGVTESIGAAPVVPIRDLHDDLGRIARHVQDHFTEPINRSTVAKSLGLRPETVSRYFTRRCGESFSSYLMGLRLSHAVALLQGTDASAVDISRMCGFDSYRTFARSFHSRYGRSPSCFRELAHT